MEIIVRAGISVLVLSAVLLAVGCDSDSDKSVAVQIPMNELPGLNATERRAMGIGKLLVNMCVPEPSNDATAFAVINLNKVFVGESIPSTNARLIGVELEGIALENVVSGALFFVAN